MKSDARTTDVQLKSAAKPSTVIRLITMQTVACHLDYSQYVCKALLFYETDQKK